MDSCQVCTNAQNNVDCALIKTVQYKEDQSWWYRYVDSFLKYIQVCVADFKYSRPEICMYLNFGHFNRLYSIFYCDKTETHTDNRFLLFSINATLNKFDKESSGADEYTNYAGINCI